jgi:hypothetical protein
MDGAGFVIILGAVAYLKKIKNTGLDDIEAPFFCL